MMNPVELVKSEIRKARADVLRDVAEIVPPVVDALTPLIAKLIEDAVVKALEDRAAKIEAGE